MADHWAISGVDLHLDIAGPRLREGLERALREAVRSGRLRPGTRLPSSRSLARDLGVARNTVADAYGQLVAEGWLAARQGSGTRVADRAFAVDAASEPAATVAGPLHYDLRPGSPDVSAFPRAGWLAAARRALAAAPDAALGYGDSRGRLELREALAAYLARARGVDVPPGRLIVCSGFTQGLALLCEALRARGARTLATEGYGLATYRDIAAARGLRVTTLPVDARGAAVAELPSARADAALLTPAHQFPLGAALAPRRRTQAVEWAIDTGGLIIEDDYDGEFRYDRQPIGAMQALAPEHVVYAGTASKTLAPGLRLGWLAVPGRLMDDVVAAKTLADRHTGSLEQLILAEFIASGAHDRQVRRARLAYRRRRDRLLGGLRRDAHDVKTTGIAAGLNALVVLPPGQEEETVIADAAGRGLALAGLSAYTAPGHEHDPALVIGYSTPPQHAYTAALARLGAALRASDGVPACGG